jgi:pentalenene oxygenase
LLGTHPAILGELRAEAETVLGHDVASWEHLPRLGLTARVVRESLRLYPPAWLIPQTCVRETRFAGRTLPAGAIVVFSPYVLQRRPDVYPHPERFDPARWLAPSARAGFLPFGAGPPKSIGDEFGLAEATLILASIAARWTLSPEPGTRVSPRAWAVLVPSAFPVRLSARKEPP